MAETRIAARVRDAEVLAGVKAAAATYRARLTHWTDAFAVDATLRQADIVVLEAANSNSALGDFHAAKSACPKAEIVILVATNTTPEDVRRLFRAGARDVLGLPVAHDQLMSALGEAIGPGTTGDANGFVLGVVKSAGGVGATTLATNIAGFLANPPRLKKGDTQEPMRVALLDFDVQFGDAALTMDITPRKDVTEILRTPKRLDSHFLDGVLERHRSGVRILAAPPMITPLEAVDADVATSIINVAARSYDIVIVELPTAWTDWVGAALRRCDHLLLVSAAAVRGVAGSRRVMDAAAELNVESARWSLAFNRLNSVIDGGDLVHQATRALGTPALASLTEDANVRAAADRGRLIWEAAPTSRFAKDLRPLCLGITKLLHSKKIAHAGRATAR